MNENGAAPGEARQPAGLDPLRDIPEIDHYELDGIPLYHIPMPGSTILTLAFGVGRAHEPAVDGGMTHLAEHVILTSIKDVFDHSNGTTEPFRVTFVTRGSPSDASKFLRDVCAAIESPRLSRMYQEARVLRTEAAGRAGMGMSLRLMWLRTGYQGIGTSALPEFFLDRLDEQRLRDWIGRSFVAGNAAIWIAGELPDDLLVSLPPGDRLPPPVPAMIEGLATPTAVVEQAPGVGTSFLVQRSFAVTAGLQALSRELHQRLRVNQGLGYEIGADYVPLSPDQAFATAWASCLPDAARDVERSLLEAIDDVAARGPAPEDLSRSYQDFLREMADPRSIPGRLDSHVRDVLLGQDPVPEPLAQQIEARWRLESEHVATAWKDVRDSMLLLIPEGGVDPQRPLERYPGPPLDPMPAGRTFEFVAGAKRRFRRSSSAMRLSIGRMGVAIESTSGRRLAAVRWADCVGIIREKGVRNVLSRDGTALPIVALEWRDGGSAVREIDRHGPRDIVIELSPGR